MDWAECSEDSNRHVFEAVNEISICKFKLVKLTYSPIEILTSLGQCNEKGETPLVIAMKGENETLIHQLVMFIMLHCDRSNAKCCAIDQLLNHQIPIMELIEHLTKYKKDPAWINISLKWYSEWLDFFAQVVFKSTSLSRQNKITVLELIGAACMPKCNEGHQQVCKYVAVMFSCWRKAMTLRYFPADGEPLLPKIPHVGVTSVASSVVFGSTVEVMSMEELNLLQKYFEHNEVDLDVEVRLRCIDLVRRQCLLVIRRISSQANHGHPHLFYLRSLHEFGIDNFELHVSHGGDIAVNVEILIKPFLLIMEQMTGFDPKLLPRKLFYIFVVALSDTSHCLALMAWPGDLRREEVSYANLLANLLAATKFIGTIAKCFPNPALMSFFCFDFERITFSLVSVLEYITLQLNNQEIQQLEEYLSNYIRNYFLERKATVLHAGVCDLLSPIFENLKLVKLIIKLGANPNAIDENGKTPLQILSEREEVNSDKNLLIFQALMDAGAHLDMAADNGDTVLDILMRNRKNRGVAAHAYFSSLINTV